MTALNVMAASALWPSGPGIALANVARRCALSWLRKHPWYRDRCGERVRVSYNPDGREQLLLSSSDDDLRGALRLSPSNPPGTL